MLLTIYRRHLPDCPHRAKGRRWTRCNCPIWVQGSRGGDYVRESMKLTAWGAAHEKVRGWEASGQVGVIRNEIPTIKEAVASTSPTPKRATSSRRASRRSRM